MHKIFSGEKRCNCFFFFVSHIIKKPNIRLQLGLKWKMYKNNVEKSSSDADVMAKLQSPRSLP